MKAHASIRFKLQTEKQLDIVFAALEPEMKTTSARSKATLQKEGEFLVLKVEAKDTVALRSALNAYLRWANSVINVLQSI